MTIYLSPDTGGKIVRLMIGGMIAFLILIGYVLWQSYEGRADLVTASRLACERGKLDRATNARGWRTAETARLSALAETEHLTVAEAKLFISLPPEKGEFPDLVAARRYDELASDLEARTGSHLNCHKVFPKAGFLP